MDVSSEIFYDFSNESETVDACELINGTFLNLTGCILEIPRPKSIFVFMQLCYVIVFVVGLCGNTMVIYVVLRYSKMQTVTNLYILSLALADECFLIGIPFFLVTSYLHYWPFGNLMCRTYMTTTGVNQFTTSLFVTVMSADRYVAVCHPISAPRLRTPFIAKALSLSVWLVSAFFMVPIVMFASAPPRGPSNLPHCNIFWPEPSFGLNPQAVFTLYSFCFGFALPVCLILIFYSLVVQKLSTVGPKRKSKEKKKSHRKVTRLVLTVITVYILCWTPYWVIQVAVIFSKPNETVPNLVIWVNLLAGCFSYCNSAVNPILYAFLSDNFKKSFVKACACAAKIDVNADLHGENSVFSRRGKTWSSFRQRSMRDSRFEEPNLAEPSVAPYPGKRVSNPSHMLDVHHNGFGKIEEEPEDYKVTKPEETHL